MKQHQHASTGRKQCPINAPCVCGDLGLKDLQKFPLLGPESRRTFGMTVVKELVDWAAFQQALLGESPPWQDPREWDLQEKLKE